MSFRDDAIEKVTKLKSKNLQAYASHYAISHLVHEIADLPELTEVSTAGRVVFCRHMGAISFLKISNVYGVIQIFVDLNKYEFMLNGESIFKYINLGDIIGVKGTIMFTTTGEKSIGAQELHLLSKCLEQISDKWHGITDVETKLRKRHLDLISHEETRQVFHTRHKLIRNIRDFLHSKGFTEVETPILQNIPSGASAYPFKTHYEALNADFYLRIAPELFLKRLVVGGYDRIFEIGKCFRNEGIDRSHLQEFTMLEFYMTYISYEELQNFAVVFLQTIIYNTLGTLKKDHMDFSQVEYISYDDLFMKYGGIRISNTTPEDIYKIAEENDLDINLYKSVDALKDAIYKKLCLSKIAAEETLRLTLVYDYPSTPLSYPHLHKPGYNYQFQIISGGFEIVRACLELTDSTLQNANFDNQMRLSMESGEKEIVRKDEDYITTQENGMPPTGGLGLGIDRLMMLIMPGKLSIRDVVLFPATKLKK